MRITFRLVFMVRKRGIFLPTCRFNSCQRGSRGGFRVVFKRYEPCQRSGLSVGFSPLGVILENKVNPAKTFRLFRRTIGALNVIVRRSWPTPNYPWNNPHIPHPVRIARGAMRVAVQPAAASLPVS